MEVDFLLQYYYIAYACYVCSRYFKNNKMEIDLTADLSILKSKLNDLEMKKQRLRQRQDKIDDLALDTLYKMEALLAKVKSVQNLASSNEETTTLSASNDYGVQSEKQQGNFTTSCVLARYTFFIKSQHS